MITILKHIDYGKASLHFLGDEENELDQNLVNDLQKICIIEKINYNLWRINSLAQIATISESLEWYTELKRIISSCKIYSCTPSCTVSKYDYYSDDTIRLDKSFGDELFARKRIYLDIRFFGSETVRIQNKLIFTPFKSENERQFVHSYQIDIKDMSLRKIITNSMIGANDLTQFEIDLLNLYLSEKMLE